MTLRNINVKQADRTFVLKNVEGLKLENVRIGGQRVDGRLEWRQAAPTPTSVPPSGSTTRPLTRNETGEEGSAAPPNVIKP